MNTTTPVCQPGGTIFRINQRGQIFVSKMELSKKDFQCEMPDFQISAQSDPILGPKVPYFVPGEVTQLMVPPLDLNRSTLVQCPCHQGSGSSCSTGSAGTQDP